MSLEGQKFFDTSLELRRHVRSTTGAKVLLAFSRGKDALGAWLALRDDGFEVTPFHLDLVPGLAFVDESIAYFERFFGVRIHRLPHPSLYRWLDMLMFQPPERISLLRGTRLYRRIDYDDVAENLRHHHGLKGAFQATGVRMYDSLTRLASMRKHGTINYKRESFFAIFDWRAQGLYDSIKTSGCRLPVDYRLWGRTFDGLDYRFLGPLKRHFPDDYQRVLKFFPLAELVVLRAEWAARRGNGELL